MKSYDRLFIGGEWVEPSSTAVFDVVSPTTEELVGRVPEAQQADVDRAVAAAREAFDRGPWPRMSPIERAAVLTKVAEAIRDDMQGMSELISNEMGSPISWGTLAQVLAPTMILDYYAGLGSTFAFDTVKDGLMGPVLVAKEPVGVVAAITPWNVPLFLACAKLAPALLSGSTVVFKPAPETPLDANVLAEIFADAGLPEGVLSVVPAGREVGEYLVNHPSVDKVS
ncbi:MAG TPA: aldehyde dehydrogenase family protein, partial [Acidimicrobiales bacterium]